MSFAVPFVRSAGDEGAKAGFAGLGLAAIAIAMFALAAFSPAVLGDGDTFSHLATGEWIIAHRAAPHVDPFSLSMAGAPWIAHEWLSEVLLTLAFRLGGWNGVAMMTGAAVASAALIVGLTAARDLRGAPLLVTVGVGLGLMTPSPCWLARICWRCRSQPRGAPGFCTRAIAAARHPSSSLC